MPNPRLDELVLHLERQVGAAGWDQPVRLYALVETADLLRREPQLADRLEPTPGRPGDLTPVDQGDLPDHASLEELLAGIGWPPAVLGAALVVERLMVPPTVEQHLPTGQAEALRFLAAHPDRQEVRLVAAALRDGSRAAALRMRAYDDDSSVLTGPDLVPGLTAALAQTLAD